MRGVPRREVAGNFGVSLAALKRRGEGEDLALRSSPGRTPRILSTEGERRALWAQRSWRPMTTRPCGATASCGKRGGAPGCPWRR